MTKGITMKKRNRNIKSSISVLIAGLSLALTGCTSNSTISQSEYSGWLQDDYVMLQQDKDHAGSQHWIHSDETLSKYTKVIIDPVKVHKVTETDFEVPQKVIDETTLYLQEALEKQFSKSYDIVTDSGPKVLRISAVISGTELTKQDLKAYNFIPVSLVVNLAKEAAGARDRVAIISMEAYARDSLTNDKIAMVVQKSAQNTSVQVANDMTADILTPTLDFWAIKAKERMDSAHSNK